MKAGTRSYGSLLVFPVIFLHLSSLALGIPMKSSPSPAHERRALWVVRTTLTSPEKIKKMVKEAHAANFNMLFVQVRGRGDAYYNSSIEPPPEEMVVRDFDALSYTLSEAHKAGLEVHAWVNVFLAWSKPAKPVNESHVANLHPEWFGAFPDGRNFISMSREELTSERIEGLFLSPGNPDVRGHLKSVVSELVKKYPLDGVHLDYIRFPTLKSGFDVVSRREFMRSYYVDPIYLETDPAKVTEYFGRSGFENLSASWRTWQIEAVTTAVREIGIEIKTLRPGTAYSAAVIPDIDTSRNLHGQDWVSWIREGYLDFAVPMCYSRSSKVVERQIKKAIESVGSCRIMAGIAIYNQHSRNAVEKIGIARKLEVLGISLFSYDSIESKKGYLQSLKKTVFRSPSEISED